MKRFSKTDGEGTKYEAVSQPAARPGLMQERETCSPRACVAFSALSTVMWLRNMLGGLVARIATARRKKAEPDKEQRETYVLKTTIQFCAVLLVGLLSGALLHAQQAASSVAVNPVPRLVSFSGLRAR